MKKNFLKFLPVAAALILATSCSKDDDNTTAITPDPTPTPAADTVAKQGYTTVPFTIKVTTGSKLSKMGLGDRGSAGVQPKFEDGDELTITGGKDENSEPTVTGIFNYTSSENSVAVFKGEFKVKDGVTLSNVELTASIGKAVEAKDGQYPAYPTIAEAVRNTSYQTSKSFKTTDLESGGSIQLAEQNAYLEISVSYLDNVDINKKDYDLTKGHVYVVLPGGTNVNSEALELNDKECQAGNIYTITKTKFKEDAEFTVGVDENDQPIKVKFSSGNLQYNPANQEWRFAPLQTDYVGGDNANISDNYEGWIDLFGWGMWLNSNGEDVINPINTSEDNSDYLPSITSSGATFSGASAISEAWTTLTGGDNDKNAEWNYLFNGRDNADDKWGMGKIGGVSGVIILPDEFTPPQGFTFTKGASDYANSYDVSFWADMESAGAVFLPAAGYREGTTVSDVGTNGKYWSSSAKISQMAGDLTFRQWSGFFPTNSNPRSLAHSVRLVRKVK